MNKTYNLEQEIIELKEKCEVLERSRENLLETHKTQLRDLRKKNNDLAKGSLQINEMVNSILIWLASQNGGEIRIPKDHLHLTKNMSYRTELTDDEYILTVEGEDK